MPPGQLRRRVRNDDGDGACRTSCRSLSKTGLSCGDRVEALISFSRCTASRTFHPLSAASRRQSWSCRATPKPPSSDSLMSSDADHGGNMSLEFDPALSETEHLAAVTAYLQAKSPEFAPLLLSALGEVPADPHDDGRRRVWREKSNAAIRQALDAGEGQK